MEIRKIDSNKLDYSDLLLEADPEIDVVKEYIDKGEMYVLFEDDGTPVAEIIITKVNDEECELKMKEIRGTKSRCIPFGDEKVSDKCVVCGKETDTMVIWGIQY